MNKVGFAQGTEYQKNHVIGQVSGCQLATPPNCLISYGIRYSAHGLGQMYTYYAYGSEHGIKPVDLAFQTSRGSWISLRLRRDGVPRVSPGRSRRRRGYVYWDADSA